MFLCSTRITLKERHNVPMLWNMITDRLHLWQLYDVSLRHRNEMNFLANLSYKNVGHHQRSHISHYCIKTETYLLHPTYITSTTRKPNDVCGKCQ